MYNGLNLSYTKYIGLQGYKDNFVYITSNEKEAVYFELKNEVSFDAYVTEHLSVVTDIKSRA